MTTRKSPAQRAKEAQVARRRWWAGVTRDLVLFTVGLALFIFEAAIRQGDPRESILFMEAGMMGLPAILRADELRRRNGRNSGDDLE